VYEANAATSTLLWEEAAVGISIRKIFVKQQTVTKS
jgi:hypothetical protein